MIIKSVALWIIIALVVLGLVIAGFKTSRAGYASAGYKVMRSEGDFEVRDYGAMTVVETPTSDGSNSDGSFMRLFDFITGANAERVKINMTTPVLMYKNDTKPTMAFVLPEKIKNAEAPKPINTAVTVREIAAGQFAVLRYRGSRNPKNTSESLAKLQKWMAAKNLHTHGPAIYGYFDPPWTPPFLRRNEVMLRIKSPE